MITIERVTPNAIHSILSQLTALLQDAVTHGASIGFMLPLPEEEAHSYWQEVAQAIEDPHRILLIAKVNDQLAGTVQLDLASRANGSHRAEVIKLMVHTSFRQQG